MSDFEKRPADEDIEAVAEKDTNTSGGAFELENTDQNTTDADGKESVTDAEIPENAAEQYAEEKTAASDPNMTAAEKAEAPEPEEDILDDLEFISHESVRDKSKAATGEVIEGEHVSRKKTKRRSVDAGAAKKETVQKIARKNIVLIIIVVIALICVLIATVSTYRRNAAKKASENKEQPISAQEYETDAYTQINEVIANYYACYADGDVDSIIQYAYPMSETEQTYIQMYSAFVESYENIVCYTKTGLDDSSYIVSVSFEVKYNDGETTAAGMDFF